MPKPLGRRARICFEAFNWAIKQLELYGKDKRVKKLATDKKEEIDNILFPKKSKYFRIAIKKGPKKKHKIKKGADPRVAAGQISGRKGGAATAAKYPYEVRREWGSKAGNTTLARYGRGFFSHIRKKRKKYPKKWKYIKLK